MGAARDSWGRAATSVPAFRGRYGPHRPSITVTSSSPPGDRGTPDPDLHSPRVAGVFAQLLDAHAADLRRYVCARAGEHHADDLVAEAFAVAIDRRSTYDPSRAPVRAWLFGITHTLLRAHFCSQDRAVRALARVHPEPEPACAALFRERGNEGPWPARRTASACSTDSGRCLGR
ncbi:RNA polymerase sigma factor [Rhodococcus erythropolis]